MFQLSFNLMRLEDERWMGRPTHQDYPSSFYPHFTNRVCEQLVRMFSGGEDLPRPRMFKNREDRFINLTSIALNNESLSGEACTQVMHGIGWSCPNLVSLDLSQVSNLAPESILFLVFDKEGYKNLHKRTR